jgi:hypothetical protein
MIPASRPQTIVSDSTASDSTASDFAASRYRDRLQGWCIIQLLPNLQRVVVRRFRKRNDAEDHLKALRRLEPDAVFIILFDLPDRKVL